MRLFVGALSIIFGLASSAEADFVTGKSLLASCTETSFFSDGKCLGYISAIADVMEHQAVNGQRKCASKRVGLERDKAIVIAWLKKHSELGNNSARVIVAQALAEVFPCK